VNIKGELIRQMREERGYSLAEFAGRASLSVSYLSEIERGTKRPSLKTIERIAAALGVAKGRLIAQDEGHGLGLGDKIRLIREKKNLTMTELAQLAGISVSYLSEIERGNVYPALHTLKALSVCLDTPLTALVGKGGTVGSKVRKAREEQGLTQAELARSANLSAGLIGQIEHGKVQPSLQTIEKIAAVLGTSPCYFILDEAGVEEMMHQMTPEVRALLMEPNVQSVLRLICNCTPKELEFILGFIKLFKRAGLDI